ncbi:kinase-like protein [Rickenella mellea]|uniref:Kinase-like protein n=1 Tax=Rickenella mellea TaxID=50990 RepID=A0A4Y7PTU9_9AGAM|nr:kinase-like protein [Rickenella mellea]
MGASCIPEAPISTEKRGDSEVGNDDVAVTKLIEGNAVGNVEVDVEGKKSVDFTTESNSDAHDGEEGAKNFTIDSLILKEGGALLFHSLPSKPEVAPDSFPVHKSRSAVRKNPRKNPRGLDVGKVYDSDITAKFSLRVMRASNVPEYTWTDFVKTSCINHDYFEERETSLTLYNEPFKQLRATRIPPGRFRLMYLAHYFGREATTWDIKHPNILPLVGFVVEDPTESPTFRHPLLIYPYSKDHSIETHLRQRPLRKSIILKFMHDILCGLGYLHSGVNGQVLVHGAVHERIAFVNNDGVAYLTDFGQGKFLADERSGYSDLETREAVHMQPPESEEMCPKGWIHANGVPIFEPSGDMWYFGLMLIRVLDYLYRIRDRQTWYLPLYHAVNQVKRGFTPSKPLGLEVDDAIWTFVFRCCVVMDLSKRIKAAEAKPFLEEFIRQAKSNEIFCAKLRRDRKVLEFSNPRTVVTVTKNSDVKGPQYIVRAAKPQELERISGGDMKARRMSM